MNKNVDWINNIYYNQQRFVNFSTDKVKGLYRYRYAIGRARRGVWDDKDMLYFYPQ